MGRAVLRLILPSGMGNEEMRSRSMSKTKFDKAMDENQETLYPVLVEFIKETNENKETDNRNT